MRSPVRIDGIAASEADWERYEADWLEAEARRADKALAAYETPCSQQNTPEPPILADGTEGEQAPSDLVAAAALQPRFLSESYWLDFEFEPGNYYFAGRERLAGREVLRIEYFPERLFDERGADDTECDRPAIRVPGAQEKFNKARSSPSGSTLLSIR